MDNTTKRLLAELQIKNAAKLLNGKHVSSVRVNSSGLEERVITITYPTDFGEK